MTAAAVERMVRRWQKRLHLDVWEIEVQTVSGEYADEKAFTRATAAWRRQSYAAIITVALGHPDTTIERNVIHELIHLLLVPWWEGQERVCDRFQNKEVGRELSVELGAYEERVVEHLARVLMECWNA